MFSGFDGAFVQPSCAVAKVFAGEAEVFCIDLRVVSRLSRWVHPNNTNQHWKRSRSCFHLLVAIFIGPWWFHLHPGELIAIGDKIILPGLLGIMMGPIGLGNLSTNWYNKMRKRGIFMAQIATVLRNEKEREIVLYFRSHHDTPKYHILGYIYNTFTYAYIICMRICICICVYVYMYICIYVYMYICIYLYAYGYGYVYVYICVCVCVCVVQLQQVVLELHYKKSIIKCHCKTP